MYNEKIGYEGVKGRHIWKQNADYASFMFISLLSNHCIELKTAY